jgi:hypothetical protein
VLGHVGSDYQASGQLVFLLPPDAQSSKVLINPYLNLQGGLSTAGALAAGHVMAEDAEQELAADGYTAEYDVALSPGTGPVLVVTAKDKDPEMAVATRDAVLARLAEALAELQQDWGIPSRQVISAQASNVGPRAEVLPGSRLRALVGTAGSAFLFLLVSTFALDRALARRRPDPEPTGPRVMAPARESRDSREPTLVG